MSKSSPKNILRILLVLVLLVFVVLKVVDVRARSRTKHIYGSISKMLDEMLEDPSSDGDGTINQAKIHELFGEPTKGFSPGARKWTDVYTSRGAFKSYSVNVEYSDLAEKLLEGVSTE